MILYINGHKMDLLAGQVIAQTKEATNIEQLEDRMSNSTNTFRLPKTANNLKALDFLTLQGNLSNVPYQKNECSLYSDTGECFVYKGWARITDGGDTFEAYIIDGIADFFKVISNKTLADLNLSELTHQKTVANVIGSWNDDRPYRYILADYNGDTGNVNTEVGVTPQVNIDYLVPSVKVSFLWNKIWNTYGAFFHGSVFESFNFQELWMTYPKGQTISGENDHTIFESTDFTSYTTTNGRYYAEWNSYTINELTALIAKRHMEVANTATYKVRVRGKISGFKDTGRTLPQSAKLYLGKNCEDISNPYFVPEFVIVGDDIPHAEDFDVTSEPFSLEELDSVCLIVTRNSSGEGGFLLWNDEDTSLHIEFVRVDPNVIDFTEAFKDFNTKDFVKEIIQRLGLNMYKDKYTPDYTFLTMKEQILTADTVEWSDKYIRKGKEGYVYGTYAKRNWFRYNYNDKESTHNDWYIDVDNFNLQDSKDIIKSRIYSPERIEGFYLGETSKVYKMFDKEIVEEPEEDEDPIKYNPLDKRYYLMRSVQRNKTIEVISKELSGMDTTTGMYFRENYYKLPFYDILQEYYSPIRQILTRAILIDVYLNLNDVDISNFDFKKLYFFEQFSNYFLINKIENYVAGRPTKVELVRVIFSEIANPPQSIKITQVVTNGRNVAVTFTMAISVPNILFEYRRTTAVVWQSVVVSEADNPFNYLFPHIIGFHFDYLIRFKAGDSYSNEVMISIPSNEIIIP